MKKTWLGWVVALLAAGILGLRGAGLEALPQPRVYERFVGIDGVCAWPRLSLLPNGELSVLIWPHPNHGLVEGAAECWNSGDNGRTWHKVGVPVPYAPGTNRLNLAGGVLPDGSYIALVAGFDHKRPASWVPTPAEKRAAVMALVDPATESLRPVPAISSDGGRTWKRYPAVDDPPDSIAQGRPPAHHLNPYGVIAPLPGGEIGVMAYSRGPAYFFVSGDQGQSWRKRGQLTADGTYDETTWLALANGDLYAVARTAASSHLDGLRSTDGGVTWRSEVALSLPGQIPGDIMRLPDGRLLLDYSVRNAGFWAICVRLGDPTARVWSAPFCLVDLQGSTDEPLMPNPPRDGGYPSTVVAADGTLVTAYYSRGVPAHNRYHMGVVRWQLPPAQSPMGP